MINTQFAKMLIFFIITLSATLVHGFHFASLMKRSSSLSSSSSSSARNQIHMSTTSFPELEKCIRKEYASFFSPMERRFYSNDVAFIDPLNSFQGVDKYQGNVDLLAGRTGLGGLLFKDASIALHNVEQLSEFKIQTRWTLQVTVKILPWAPRPKFTGVSIYTLDSAGVVQKQEDYWDSINLLGGGEKYGAASFSTGLKDFLGQLSKETGAVQEAPELPYELLRRAERYEVRRYPATLCIETTYDQRNEGYDRLGSYAGGSNEEDKRILYYAPTVMRITDDPVSGAREKRMAWPILYTRPGASADALNSGLLPKATIGKVDIVNKPEQVVAVTRFTLAATEPVVRGYTKQLIGDVTKDGLTITPDAERGDCTVGQFDALFSLNKRRNEVWVELETHPWQARE